MEIVGIVLWPVIGLVYIAYKLFKEEPGMARRFFSWDTLVIAGIVLTPPILLNIIKSYFHGVVGFVLMLLLLIALCALVILMIMSIIAEQSEPARIWMRKAFDPVWREVYTIPCPSVSELDEMTRKRFIVLCGSEQKANEFMERVASDSSMKQTREMQRSASLHAWEREQYKRIAESYTGNWIFKRKKHS